MRQVERWKLTKRVRVRRRALLHHRMRAAERAFDAVNSQIAANLEAIWKPAPGELTGRGRRPK